MDEAAPIFDRLRLEPVATGSKDSDVPHWNRDRTVELVEVDGQVLTVDMREADSFTIAIPRDVHEWPDRDGEQTIRRLGEMTTVVFTCRVPSAAVRWA